MTPPSYHHALSVRTTCPKQALQGGWAGREDDLESAKKKLKVGFLEERLGRTLGVGRVGNDDVKGVFVAFQELEPVANMDGSLGVLEPDGHGGQVLLGNPNDSL